MLTLDEAITHAKEVAKANRDKAESYNRGEDYEQIKANECAACAEEHEQLASWLEELAKRREADRWIPVSERLPEDRNLVLVTAYWHETYQVMQASYFGEGEKNGWWCVPWNNCGKHMRNDLHVIAWKPLPEPYKEELKPTKDLINDIIGFDVSEIKPLPEFKESEDKT